MNPAHPRRIVIALTALLLACPPGLPGLTSECHALLPVPRFEAVLINGGGRPAINYQSHLLHIKQFKELLHSWDVPDRHITIFNADGLASSADLAVREPQGQRNFWLLHGTRLAKPLRTRVRFENSRVEGMDVRPATPAALREWFEDAADRLMPGSTLLLYVTDHGKKNKDDVSNNTITMWGDNVALSVNELKDMIALLDPQVRVVALMSHCFSGSFANIMYAGSNGDVPRENVVGYFASTAERPAYGCYPENRDKDNVGHSFRFIDALRSSPSFVDAHQEVLVTDRSPDVPLKTSDVFIDTLLEDAAAHAGIRTNDFIDGLLQEAWRDKGRWEPSIRLLDRIGRAFGYFSPRSLSELEQQATLLPDISSKFKAYGQAWRRTQHALARANLERFLEDRTDWTARVTEQALEDLDHAAKRELTAELLADLQVYTNADAATCDRLQSLKFKTDASNAARYRMQVRLGVVLRMETVLKSIAGRLYLEQSGAPAEQRAYEQLVRAEQVTPRDVVTRPRQLNEPQPFPSYEEELALAAEVLPAWLGIRFRPASEQRREQHGLLNGAVSVLTVYPDSAAEAAGLVAGDIILGPSDTPFDERQRIREWVMTSAIGEPQEILVQRGDDREHITFTPQPFPLKWPELPAPPKAGSAAPVLARLDTYRGTVPAEFKGGGPYLLTFWATWCGPCKAAMPELIAYERQRNTKVIAITDEMPAQLDPFFAKYEGVFPESVAYDELRLSFRAYGVSGTPCFVLIDENGVIEHMWTGYRASEGLEIEGWSWSQESESRAN